MHLPAFFEDDHVQVALVMTPDGRLVTTIERLDLAVGTSSSLSQGLASLSAVLPGHRSPLGAVPRRRCGKGDTGWLSLTIPARSSAAMPEGRTESATAQVTAPARAAGPGKRSLAGGQRRRINSKIKSIAMRRPGAR